MFLECFAICDSGLVREENQDNLYLNGVFRKDISDNSVFRYKDTRRDYGLYAVADGMGGEKHGELASLIAVEGMGNVVLDDAGRDMTQYLIERNAVICDFIKENGGARIGSTFVGLCIDGTEAHIVNIGDSRAYLSRNSELIQLTQDHTPIRPMVELGVITKEVARTHPDRHRLTQHLGVLPSEMVIEPYSAHIDVSIGDIFLLCSDGLTDMVEDASLSIILSSPVTLEEKAETLFATALHKGGKDNISILLVQIRAKGGS